MHVHGVFYSQQNSMDLASIVVESGIQQSIICGTSRRATIYCVNAESAERVWLSVIFPMGSGKKSKIKYGKRLEVLIPLSLCDGSCYAV